MGPDGKHTIQVHDLPDNDKCSAYPHLMCRFIDGVLSELVAYLFLQLCVTENNHFTLKTVNNSLFIPAADAVKAELSMGNLKRGSSSSSLMTTDNEAHDESSSGV